MRLLQMESVEASADARLARPPQLQTTVLQEQRARVVPPLPRTLTDLAHAIPHFKEEAGEPHPHPFPQFAALRPLFLRSAGLADSVVAGNAGLSSSLGTTGAGSADSTVGSAGSSAPQTASSCASTASHIAQGDKPLRVGVVCAGEASGVPAHPVNVVAGLLAYLSAVAPGSRILGFLDGPSSLIAGQCRELSPEEVRESLNQGAFKLLSYGTCSDGGFSIAERLHEAHQAAAVCTAERLDGLVVIAGPRDLSWAATLAACFAEAECRTTVVGVPHSKNLNLYVPRCMPITLGFDSARRMLSEVAGNIVLDSLSSNKYWHFIRCGADALTMEVALQTRCPVSVLTMEHRPTKDAAGETLQERMSLQDAAERLKEVIERRRTMGRPSGVVLLSHHIIEMLPEMEKLKQELLELLGNVDAESVSSSKPPSIDEVGKNLEGEDTRELFKRLPRVVQMCLISNRDSMGMPLLPTDLEAERILGRFVQQELKASSVKASFAPRFHSVDLMSNAPLPSPFDCAFGYLLGHTAGALVCERQTYYVASCASMHLPVVDWEPCAVPFSYLYPQSDNPQEVRELNSRTDPEILGIHKRGRFLRQNLWKAYKDCQETWVDCNAFKAPGPMQFGDDGEVGPMSERPYSLLAEYLTLDELKQLIQPVMTLPPPIKVSIDPLVMRDVRVFENLSALEQRRISYKPALPQYLRMPLRVKVDDIHPLACTSTKALAETFSLTQSSSVQIVPKSDEGTTSLAPDTSQHPLSPRPLRVGVVFASNQVPGFHNVVAGLFDYLRTLTVPGEILGFLGGFSGLVKNLATPIDMEMVDQYRNLGGQDMLCQFAEPASLAFKNHLKAVIATIAKRQLDGLVLVGNLESHVDSAFIAEACAAERLPTRVVGVPVSLHSNFPFVQQTVGYDTICRTLSSYIGNVGNMAKVSGNKWVFTRIVGDAWSHVAVECALQAFPNLVLLSGSWVMGQSLAKIVKIVCDVIVGRHEAGCDYGLVLLPMGFVTDVTEMRLLFTEIMEIMASSDYETSWDSIPNIATKLKPQTAALFDVIPRDVQYEICFGGRERGTHKIDLSVISTDRLLLRFVEIELQRRRQLNLFKDVFFRGCCCPMVYQARSCMPTNFDCDLAYTLGWGAGVLVCLGKTAQLVHASHLELCVDEWRVGGIPLTSLLSTEYDEEAEEHKILPASVQLLKQRGIVRPFLSRLPSPLVRDPVFHGPVQFWGLTALHPSQRTTWYMENMPLQDPTEALRDIERLCSELQSTMAKAQAESTLLTVNSLLSNALSVLESYKHLDETSKNTTRSLADVPIEQEPQVWRTRRRAPTKFSAREAALAAAIEVLNP